MGAGLLSAEATRESFDYDYDDDADGYEFDRHRGG